MGPCALEYTKLKTSDHLWTDPSANELVQRHRIHGAHRSQDTTAGRRPALGVSVEAELNQLLQEVFGDEEFFLLKIFSILDPQETVQWQHVRGQVCCISEGVCRVSSPKLQNTPSLWQKQRPGATGMTAYHSVIIIIII